MSVTIKDIAKLAGVSTATVSKIVNGKDSDIGEATIMRVRKIILEQNYRPNSLARSMKTKVTKTVGLIIPDVRNPFFTDLARGAEDSANKNGYSLLFCNTDDDLDKEMRYIDTLTEKQVDGIALAPSILRNREKEEKFHVRVPMVTMDRNVYFKGIKARMDIDNFQGAYDAVTYLISLGHRRIKFLSGQQDVRVSQNRISGYRKALEDHGIAYDEKDVVFGFYKSEFGYNYIMSNRLEDDVTAIFCGNDLIALGVIKALKEKNLKKVPQDISIIGFDDIYLAGIMTPSLTTVRQPSYDFGFLAMQKLIDILEGSKHIEKKTEIRLELIIRESTAPARAEGTVRDEELAGA